MMPFFRHLLTCSGEEVEAFLERNRNQSGTYNRDGRVYSFDNVIKYRLLLPKYNACIAQALQPIERCRFCKSVCAANAAYNGLKLHFDGCSFVKLLRERVMSILGASTTEDAEQIVALMPEGSEFEEPVGLGLKCGNAKY